MPDLIPVATSPTETVALVPAPVAGDAAAADAVRAAAALLAVTGTAVAPGGLAEPAAVHTVISALALAVKELPGLFRLLSGRSGDAYAGRPGCQLMAAASFWFQMEAAADAAARLSLALNTAHAAALQLDRGI